MINRLLFGALFSAMFALAACGGDDCVTAGNAICEAACACTAGDECKMVTGTSSASATVTFDNEAGCKAFYELGCALAEGEADVDASACIAALDAPMCVDTDQGLSTPAACE